MGNKKEIIIADDHPVVRNGIVSEIGKNDKFIIKEQCSNGSDAYKLILQIKPDIAIVDISMPELDGIEIIRRTKKEMIKTKFIILTMYNDEEYFNTAMELDVRGYLLKDTALSELNKCLEAVSNDGHYISPELSEYLIKNNDAKVNNSIEHKLSQLSTTEKKILKLLSQNKTSKEIAEDLFISYRTVQNHRIHICQKLNLHGTNSLLEFVLKNKKLINKI